MLVRGTIKSSFKQRHNLRRICKEWICLQNNEAQVRGRGHKANLGTKRLVWGTNEVQSQSGAGSTNLGQKGGRQTQTVSGSHSDV